MNQLFIVSDAAWAATTPLEVFKIVEDLKELGLYSLPYPEIDIGISLDAAVVWTDANGKPENRILPDHRIIEGKSHPPLGPEYLLIYRGVTLDGFRDASLSGPDLPPVEAVQAPRTIFLLRDCLISLLATRNTRLVTHLNKLARLGIGSAKRKPLAKRYTYTTTISPPLEMEDDVEHKPTGRTVCPHLRRGHIRKQHFGPNNQFAKRIWIPPVFVNASEEFTRTRQAYNLSMPSSALTPTDVGSLEPTT